jgi:hypothetical protein
VLPVASLWPFFCSSLVALYWHARLFWMYTYMVVEMKVRISQKWLIILPTKSHFGSEVQQIGILYDIFVLRFCHLISPLHFFYFTLSIVSQRLFCKHTIPWCWALHNSRMYDYLLAWFYIWVISVMSTRLYIGSNINSICQAFKRFARWRRCYIDREDFLFSVINIDSWLDDIKIIIFRFA